jgi:hypothetical protein
MTLNFIGDFYKNTTTVRNFTYNGISLNCISIDSVNDENLNLVDFIPFESVEFSIRPGYKSDADILENNHIRIKFRNHPNFKIAVENPNIPIMIFHQHEILFAEQLDVVYQIIFEELKRNKGKVIIIDCSLTKRDGVINPPILNKLKQFYINVFKEESDRNKKFTFLNNKNNIKRFQILDKIIKNYKSDVKLLRNENVISFRNYDEEIKTYSKTFKDKHFQELIDKSKYYKFHNTSKFYRNIGLPWVFDEFKIDDVYNGMFLKPQRLYSQSFFSIISDTYYNYLDLDNEKKPNELAFSEKTFISLSAGTLPFIITFGKFYVELEKEGFDFSYLKTVFDIDYKENDLRQNFDSIDKFINFLNSKSIGEIESVYKSLKPIVEKNIDLIRKLENKELTPEIKDFLNQIKSLK